MNNLKDCYIFESTEFDEIKKRISKPMFLRDINNCRDVEDLFIHKIGCKIIMTNKTNYSGVRLFLHSKDYDFGSKSHFDIEKEKRNNKFNVKIIDGQKESIDIQYVYFMHEEYKCSAYKMYKTAIMNLNEHKSEENFIADIEELFRVHNDTERDIKRAQLFKIFKEDKWDKDSQKDALKFNI